MFFLQFKFKSVGSVWTTDLVQLPKKVTLFSSLFFHFFDENLKLLLYIVVVTFCPFCSLPSKLHLSVVMLNCKNINFFT